MKVTATSRNDFVVLKRHQDRVEHQLAELVKCEEIITRKVGFYADRLAVGSAHNLWTGHAAQGPSTCNASPQA